MKARIVLKNGSYWEFRSVKEARKYVKKGIVGETKIINGKKYKIFK